MTVRNGTSASSRRGSPACLGRRVVHDDPARRRQILGGHGRTTRSMCSASFRPARRRGSVGDIAPSNASGTAQLLAPPRPSRPPRRQPDALRRGVDELAVPELEHQQRPDPLGVVVDAGGVAVEQAADLVRAEAAALERRAVEQDVARVVAQLAAEPVADRERKPRLGRSRISSGTQPRSASRRTTSSRCRAA